MHSYLIMQRLSSTHIFIFSSMGQYMQRADHVQNVVFVMYHIGGALSLGVRLFFTEDNTT